MVSLVFAYELYEGRAHGRCSVNLNCMDKRWEKQKGLGVRGPIPDPLCALKRVLAFSEAQFSQ